LALELSISWHADSRKVRSPQRRGGEVGEKTRHPWAARGRSARVRDKGQVMSTIPIAILAFNRTDYLEQTLASLAQQDDGALAGREIHLFQDGIVNHISRTQYALPEVMSTNIANFRRLFPAGHVHVRDQNVGIARHFDFVERYFFEGRGFEVAIFLEDDLILSPKYLSIMDQLIDEALRNEQIGYVAAYGDHRASLADQRANLSTIMRMDHKWAFALTRRQWLRQHPLVQEYLQAISHMDYNKRDEGVVIDWLLTKGILPLGTSQDGIKDAAMYMSGATKLMTYACYGKYVGKIGTHFSDAIYERMGFGHTELCPDVAADYDWPTSDQLDVIVAEERKRLSDNVCRVQEIFPFYRM
jgi:hypothetical protein